MPLHLPCEQDSSRTIHPLRPPLGRRRKSVSETRRKLSTSGNACGCLATALLRYLQTKNFLIEMMGAETVCPLELSDDEGLREDLRQPGEELIQLIEAEATAWRVETHNHVQYVVGKQLEQGKGVKDAANFTHDPSVCQHPSHLMKGRGGKKRSSGGRA